MINQINLLKKGLLATFLLMFTVTGSTDASNYEVGDVFEAKKRTTAVLLYMLKNDLLLDIRQHSGKTGIIRQRDSRYVYELQKGDKIVLLKEYPDEKVFRVALVPKRKSKGSDSPFYYTVPSKFNQLVFVEHLTE
ncbi:MAG: hypothetical protein QF895_02520 [SAR86 cluster bacterium]|nr:hypothetical protein [SAR86 cluster bacterium]